MASFLKVLIWALSINFAFFLDYGAETFSSPTSEENTGPVIFEPEFTKIVDGIPGAEGPVFDTSGNFYMVAPEVEKNGQYAGEVLKVDLNRNETSLLVAPAVDGYGGIPAGAQSDKEGNLWITDMRLGILKVTQDGHITQHGRSDSAGRTMQGCNDCIFDYQGSLWVTAPAWDIAPAPYRRSFQDRFGCVYCMLKDGQVVRVDTGIRFPNGIAVLHTDDGRPKKLIVAETPTKLLWGYDIQGPGNITNKAVWGKLPDGPEGGADGMDFDEDNNLLVAHWGSGFIEVFGPNGGQPHTRIKCPFSKTSNLHFRPQSNTVYVTEHDTFGLWKFEWERKGKRQSCEL